MSRDPMTLDPAFQSWAIEFINPRLKPDAIGFEWGSGWSTLWLGARCEKAISLEHDKAWYDTAVERLAEYRLTNIELIHEPHLGIYADHILSMPNDHFDIICVDGRDRAKCITNALAKLKPGIGMLVLDDYPRKQYQEAIKLMATWSSALFWRGSEIMATAVWVRPAK